MNTHGLLQRALGLALVGLLLAGCGAPAGPTPQGTAIPPTEAALPPTATARPTAAPSSTPALAPTPLPPTAVPTAEPSTAVTEGEALDAYVRAYAGAGLFMGAVLVARDDEVLLSQGYGWADVANGVPNTPSTRFRLGSVTKGFTAAAILQLQEAGLLSVDDPISQYLPDYPGGDRITVHHLLNHTSGVPNYIALEDIFDRVLHPIEMDELIALFSPLELEFPPGQQHRYSNSGYVLLTKIVEQVSGQRYADYVQEHLLEPAGMARSGYAFYGDALEGDRAVGYHFTGEEYLPTPRWDTSWAVGAGALYSTAEDMYHWIQALDTDTLLGEDSRRALFTPGGAADFYGYGWYAIDFLGRRRVLHGGYVFGFRSDVTRYPDDGITIVVLSNLDRAPTRQMSEDLAAVLFGAPYELPVLPTPTEVDPAILETYAGQYDCGAVLGAGAVVSITVEDGRLVYQANSIYDSLGLPVVLYPESETVFLDKVGECRCEFVSGADGAVTGLSLSDPYESYWFRRIGP